MPKSKEEVKRSEIRLEISSPDPQTGRWQVHGSIRVGPDGICTFDPGLEWWRDVKVVGGLRPEDGARYLYALQSEIRGYYRYELITG